MIMVIGAGAVGTSLTAYLMHRAATSATAPAIALYARDKERAAFENAGCLRVDYAKARQKSLITPLPRLVDHLSQANAAKTVLLCIKYPALAALMAQLGDLPPSTTLVSTLNGMSALRELRARYPHNRVIPISVMYNVQHCGVLHARITTAAQIVIGSAAAQDLQPWQGSGLRVGVGHGDASVWGKLLINLTSGICALTHATFRDVLTDPDLRCIYVALLDEATRTLQQAGVPYQLPMPLPYAFYRRMLAGRSPLPWWFARWRNGVQQGAYPSMVSDIVHQRRTEIDQLSGEIVTLGRQHGIATPINSAITDRVHGLQTQQPPTYLTAAALRQALGLSR